MQSKWRALPNQNGRQLGVRYLAPFCPFHDTDCHRPACDDCLHRPHRPHGYPIVSLMVSTSTFVVARLQSSGHFSHFPYSPCHFKSCLVSTSIISRLLNAPNARSSIPFRSDTAVLTRFSEISSLRVPLRVSILLFPMLSLSGDVFVLVLECVVDAAVAPAICTWVIEMNSRILATRRFISFIVVLLGFIWRALEGLPRPLDSPWPFVMPFARGVPPSAFCELLLGTGEDLA